MKKVPKLAFGLACWLGVGIAAGEFQAVPALPTPASPPSSQTPTADGSKARIEAASLALADINRIIEQRFERQETRFQTHLVQLAIAVAVVTLFVGIFSLSAAILTFVGKKSMAKWTHQEVEVSADRLIKNFEAEQNLMTGLLYGRLCRNEEFKLVRKDLLPYAIALTSKALKHFEAVQDETKAWKARNNLAYYWAFEARPTNSDNALALAKRLREECPPDREGKYVDTHARVLAAFSDSANVTKPQLEEARRTLNSLIESQDIAESRKVVFRGTLEKVEDCLTRK